MKILLTGGDGYIAKSLYSFLKERRYEVFSVTRRDFDLSNSASTKEWFKNKAFDVLIHCATKGGRRLKADDSSVLDENLKMYYNLLENSDKFNKFISFGSGAEIFQTETPYGLSKKVISESIKQKENFYNIRIYAVFDENESENRFIKANLFRYINKQPIEILENKSMDFFYMKDLLTLIEYYLKNNNLQKEIECCYKKRYKLIDIANYINLLSNYSVPILCSEKNNSDYCGKFNLPIQTIGLELGVKETYNKIIEKKYG